ncbi:MAG: hypothetical protein PHV02_10690 [Rhodocyclaceae bacterium]|nr:hypothetical protein [Rhodocyclaceae bacterium]
MLELDLKIAGLNHLKTVASAAKDPKMLIGLQLPGEKQLQARA